MRGLITAALRRVREQKRVHDENNRLRCALGIANKRLEVAMHMVRQFQAGLAEPGNTVEDAQKRP